MNGWVELSIVYAWISILAGVVAGAILGLFFHKDNFLGGYGTFKRRMFRLGHIACFGMAFVNLSFALSVDALGLHPTHIGWCFGLMIGAGALMPTLCFLSGWRESFRNLFFLPVTALSVGAVLFVVEVTHA